MASAPHTLNARMAALVAAGTAPWLDQIRRGLISSGELARLRDEYALRATETPTALALSRQSLPVLDPELVPEDAIERGAMIGMRTFGASGPQADVYAHFDITVAAVVEQARALLST